MAINLQKGQTISLEKQSDHLSQITIGLGWKIQKKGFLAGLTGGKSEYDLDAIAFVLNEQGEVTQLGEKLVGGDVVFFNNLRHPSGEIYHSGDNRVGGTGATDDEQIVVRLGTIPARYHRVLFLVQIYQGVRNHQHFGKIESAYMRAVDANGTELARYDLDTGSACDGKCVMVFGEVYRQAGGWQFRALGEGHATDNFVDILKSHV